jgi:hypothetical protein
MSDESDLEAMLAMGQGRELTPQEVQRLLNADTRTIKESLAVIGALADRLEDPLAAEHYVAALAEVLQVLPGMPLGPFLVVPDSLPPSRRELALDGLATILDGAADAVENCLAVARLRGEGAYQSALNAAEASAPQSCVVPREHAIWLARRFEETARSEIAVQCYSEGRRALLLGSWQGGVLGALAAMHVGMLAEAEMLVESMEHAPNYDGHAHRCLLACLQFCRGDNDGALRLMALAAGHDVLVASVRTVSYGPWLAPARELASIGRRAEVEQYLVDCAAIDTSMKDDLLAAIKGLRAGEPLMLHGSEPLTAPLPRPA